MPLRHPAVRDGRAVEWFGGRVGEPRELGRRVGHGLCENQISGAPRHRRDVVAVKPNSLVDFRTGHGGPALAQELARLRAVQRGEPRHLLSGPVLLRDVQEIPNTGPGGALLEIYSSQGTRVWHVLPGSGHHGLFPRASSKRPRGAVGDQGDADVRRDAAFRAAGLIILLYLASLESFPLPVVTLLSALLED